MQRILNASRRHWVSSWILAWGSWQAHAPRLASCSTDTNRRPSELALATMHDEGCFRHSSLIEIVEAVADVVLSPHRPNPWSTSFQRGRSSGHLFGNAIDKPHVYHQLARCHGDGRDRAPMRDNLQMGRSDSHERCGVACHESCRQPSGLLNAMVRRWLALSMLPNKAEHLEPVCSEKTPRPLHSLPPIRPPGRLFRLTILQRLSVSPLSLAAFPL
jgi:hypothetical protein